MKRAHLAPQYLAWVRTMPCAGCAAVVHDGESGHDPHHFGPRGVGQKCDDFNTTPLCSKCHRYFHDHGLLPGDTTRAETERTLYRSQALLIVEWIRLQQAKKRADDDQKAKHAA